tara:strand:+ start:378 stop:698 length:321 start_codon:yes stop_codon:yes gene_type:complete
MYTHPQQGSGADTAQLRQEAGRWLKSLRDKVGLSQRELAKAVGIDYYTFISQIEAGRGRIPPDRYEAFAIALEMDVTLFVKNLIQYYDPITHKLLFQQDHQHVENR